MELPNNFRFVHRRDGPTYTAEFVDDWVRKHGFLYKVKRDDKPDAPVYFREDAIMNFIESEAWEMV
jgi:hypothetical protein